MGTLLIMYRRTILTAGQLNYRGAFSSEAGPVTSAVFILVSSTGFSFGTSLFLGLATMVLALASFNFDHFSSSSLIFSSESPFFFNSNLRVIPFCLKRLATVSVG
jgi:hypothetical protein